MNDAVLAFFAGSDVGVVEFLRELGIGFSAAVPVALAAFFVLKTYTRAELSELKANFQQELDARTIEFSSSHVSVEEFGRCQRASSEMSAQITRRLDAIDGKIDRLLVRMAIDHEGGKR